MAALAGLGLGPTATTTADTLFLVTSDHGNLEDLAVATHTRNPVPLLAWGTAARSFIDGVTALDEVAPAILRQLVA